MTLLSIFKFIHYLRKEKACVFKTIKYNFFSKHVKSNNHGRIIIYPRTVLFFGKNSEIILEKEYVYFGKKHPYDGDGFTTIKLLDDAIWNASGRSFIYPNSTIIVENDASLSTEKIDTNYGSIIRVGKSIKIGTNCVIGRNAYICDNDHHDIIINGQKKSRFKNIIIGDKVWIGVNVLILKGVTIGSNVVIAANSLVNKDIASNTLYYSKNYPVYTSEVDWEE